jgi:signal transduction histidine kinase
MPAEAASNPLPAILVVEASDTVYKSLKRNLVGNLPRLVRAADYRSARKLLSGQAVEWVLCDSAMKQGDAFVCDLVQRDFPDLGVSVFYDPAEPNASQRSFDSCVFAIETERLTAPDSHTLLQMLSVLHENDVRMKKLRKNFRGKERLTRLGELTRGIFHDLNNRLTGIIGFLEMTKMHNPGFRDLDGVIAQCKQMDAMFTNVLRIARQERGQDIRLLNLNALIREDLKLLEGDSLYRDMVVKEFQFDETLPMIYGIYSDFSMSFMNIAKNAIEAMHSVEERVLRIVTGHENDWIFLSVEDTGIGIDPKDLPRIFQPFFTTKPIETREGVPAGTGLGLSNARELLLKYGAQWDIDSKLGIGTRITLRIPVKNDLMGKAVSQ